jgi:hypothetical protein
MGHAVRGVALAQAAKRVGVNLRAFGPPKPDIVDCEYEGSEDWETEVVAFAPDLLLGDLQWIVLDRLRKRLCAPAWLLLRWTQPGHTSNIRSWRIESWERRISIEPASDATPSVTHRISPIVVDEPRFTPVDGQALRAGYNAWWEAAWFGYGNRVRWYTDGSPERQARIDAGVRKMTENGADALMRMVVAG